MVKPPLKKPTSTALHIATSLRIIRKHRNAPGIDVAGAREAIKRTALYADTDAETKADVRMREDLERRTGMSIAELAAIAEHWPD